MSTRPRVSVVMNCYNGAAYLREALESMRAQTFPDWELIFWDNASTDQSAAIAAAFNDPRLRYFRAEATTPLGEARSLALARATGDYISFLDTDDVYQPEMLARQVRLLESGAFAFVCAGITTIDAQSRVIKHRPARYESGDLFGRLLFRYDVKMCTVVMRRDILERDGLQFNARFKYCPDYHLFMQLAAAHPVGVHRGPLVNYRVTPGSLTRKVLSVVSSEIGETLDVLEARFPERCAECRAEMQHAREKLHFYDAVYRISEGDYRGARAELAPVVGTRWEYRLIDLALRLRLPQSWLLTRLNR